MYIHTIYTPNTPLNTLHTHTYKARKMRVQVLVLRWANAVLQEAHGEIGYDRVIENFGSDLRDSEALGTLNMILYIKWFTVVLGMNLQFVYVLVYSLKSSYTKYTTSHKISTNRYVACCLLPPSFSINYPFYPLFLFSHE